MLIPHSRSGIRWSSRRSLGSSFGCPRPPFEPLARLAVAHGGLVLGQPLPLRTGARQTAVREGDRKSTRLNSSHLVISYAVFCLKKKKSRQRSHSRSSHPTVGPNNGS